MVLLCLNVSTPREEPKRSIIIGLSIIITIIIGTIIIIITVTITVTIIIIITKLAFVLKPKKDTEVWRSGAHRHLLKTLAFPWELGYSNNSNSNSNSKNTNNNSNNKTKTDNNGSCFGSGIQDRARRKPAPKVRLQDLLGIRGSAKV